MEVKRLYYSIFVCILVRLGSSEVQLYSSSLNDVVCRTNPLAFYCRATGSLNGLFWSLNDSVIHEYTAIDDKRVYFHNETNSYSVLYRNVRGPDIHESKLVFLDLPQAPLFKIACSFAGSAKSMIITIIDSKLPSVALKEPVVRAGHIAKASWDHANTNNMTLFYHVILNDQTVGRVRESKTLIELPQCEEYYSLRVDVEDICNKVSVGDPVQFSCPQIAGEGISNGEVTGSTSESNVVNEKCDDGKLTKDLVIVILSLLLLLLIGFPIILVVVMLRKELSATIERSIRPEENKKKEVAENKLNEQTELCETTTFSDPAVEDGQRTVLGGQTMVEDGQTTVEDGQTTVENEQMKVKDGQVTVEDGQKTVEDGQTTDEDGQKTVEDGQTTDEDGQKTVED